VAGPAGRWATATVRRVNEDGTFTVEFDVKDMEIMPYWYGVPPAEVSFNDASLWPAVFARLALNGTLARSDFPAALATLGYPMDADEALGLWDRSYMALFTASAAQAAGRPLGEAEAYRLFLDLGLSAKLCAENLNPHRVRPYFKLYWNQVRMGGRDPAEVRRPVTLDDAVVALGLSAERVDRKAADCLERFERDNGVRLPSALKEFLHLRGVADAVRDCHPNNPGLVEFRHGRWALRRGMRALHLDGEFALPIVVLDNEWAVVFNDGEADARVYVHWDASEGQPEAWLPTAPGLGLFFWDLAQTGLAWYQHTKFQGGKRVRRTDIGLVPD
jgi:hypothetical protein